MHVHFELYIYLAYSRSLLVTFTFPAQARILAAKFVNLNFLLTNFLTRSQPNRHQRMFYEWKAASICSSNSFSKFFILQRESKNFNWSHSKSWRSKGSKYPGLDNNKHFTYSFWQRLITLNSFTLPKEVMSLIYRSPTSSILFLIRL